MPRRGSSPARTDRGASVTIERMVEWPDTDAAGHYHHSAVIRWIEAAEAELHEQVGLPELFGTVPRVRYEVDYLARLWFRDRISVRLWVGHVGTTSLRYEFEVRRQSGTGSRSGTASQEGAEVHVAARGAMVCVHSEPGAGPTPWPEQVTRRLMSRR